MATAKVGRPALEISQTDLSVIEAMAKVGCVLDDIALALDVSPSTLDRWLKLPEVERAYKKGRAIAKHTMAARLWDVAMTQGDDVAPAKGAITAIIFWLKAQAQWSDRPQAEETGDVQQVQIFLPSNSRDEL